MGCRLNGQVAERLRTSRFSGLSLLSALPDAKGEATLVPRISMTRDQNRAEGNSATLGAHQEAVPRRKVYPFPRRPKRRRRTLRQPPPAATGTCASALAATPAPLGWSQAHAPMCAGSYIIYM